MKPNIMNTNLWNHLCCLCCWFLCLSRQYVSAVRRPLLNSQMWRVALCVLWWLAWSSVWHGRISFFSCKRRKSDLYWHRAPVMQSLLEAGQQFPCLHGTRIFLYWAHKIPFTNFYLPVFNPLNAELNPICYLLALLGAHHFLHVSRIRVKSLTLRSLTLYIYGAPILDVSRSHTTTQHSR